MLALKCFTQFFVDCMFANKHSNDENTHTHLQNFLSVDKIINSSQHMTHTLCRSEVDWSHELISTVNDRPQPVKGRFTAPMK